MFSPGSVLKSVPQEAQNHSVGGSVSVTVWHDSQTQTGVAGGRRGEDSLGKTSRRLERAIGIPSLGLGGGPIRIHP